MKRLIVAVLLLTAALTCRAAEVGSLRCEYLADPLGIDATRPRLSWVVSSSLRGDRQTAYRVLVASSPELLARGEGDLWDSGKTASGRSIQVEYGGKSLAGLAKCYWKVQVWDADDRPSRWSEPARWSMGPLCEEDWGRAEWIAARDEETWRNEWAEHKRRDVENREPNTWPWFVGTGRTIWDLYENASPRYDPSPLMRKEFSVGRKVVSADLYVCGLGYYEAYLNGRRVGDHVLDPAWTNFHKRAFYVTYDVTGMIRRGGNAIGIMLGRGQYSPICTDIWGLYRSKWVGQPKAIALLAIRYSDGTTERIVTDESWRTAGGPVVYDDTRHGELYDARLEQDGWSEAGFSAEGWRPAVSVPGAGPLRAQMMPPVRAFDPIEPVRTFDRGNGQTIYDAGHNIAGWARVRVRGPEGARVLVEYCELPSDRELVPDIHPSKLKIRVEDTDYASFYDKSINIRQQNGYILKGKGTETFECRFAYMGFQFVRVTADPGVTVERVEAVPVHTDVAEAGRFVCSNDVVNRLQDMSRASLLNNFHSIPTDCPHREKQGWTADTYMTDQAAIYNFDMAAFYAKWVEDLAGTQDSAGGLCTVAPSTGYDQSISTVWPAAIVYVPWDLLAYYGDRRVVERHYETMMRFAESGLLRQRDGKPEIIGEVLGDWVSPHMTLSDTLMSYSMAPPEGLTLYGTASHYRVVRKSGRGRPLSGQARRCRAAGRLGRPDRPPFQRGVFRCRFGYLPRRESDAVQTGRQRRAPRVRVGSRGRQRPGARQPAVRSGRYAGPDRNRFRRHAVDDGADAEDRSRAGLPSGDAARLSGLGIHGSERGDDDVGDVGRLGLAQSSALLPDQRLFLQISGRHPVRPGLSGLRTLHGRSLGRRRSDVRRGLARLALRPYPQRMEARRLPSDDEGERSGRHDRYDRCPDPRCGGRCRVGTACLRDRRGEVSACGRRQGVLRGRIGKLRFYEPAVA